MSENKLLERLHQLPPVGVSGLFHRVVDIASVSSFGADDDGQMWVVTISGSANGTLVRLAVRTVV